MWQQHNSMTTLCTVYDNIDLGMWQQDISDELGIAYDLFDGLGRA